MQRSVVYLPSTCSFPSCLHTTSASSLENPLLHTVPQALLTHTSSRHWLLLLPPLSLTSPSEQLAYDVFMSVEIRVLYTWDKYKHHPIIALNRSTLSQKLFIHRGGEASPPNFPTLCSQNQLVITETLPHFFGQCLLFVKGLISPVTKVSR